jgi:hypothetical protein
MQDGGTTVGTLTARFTRIGRIVNLHWQELDFDDGAGVRSPQVINSVAMPARFRPVFNQTDTMYRAFNGITNSVGLLVATNVGFIQFNTDVTALVNWGATGNIIYAGNSTWSV